MQLLETDRPLLRPLHPGRCGGAYACQHPRWPPAGGAATGAWRRSKVIDIFVPSDALAECSEADGRLISGGLLGTHGLGTPSRPGIPWPGCWGQG